jgi:hypothetical protein
MMGKTWTICKKSNEEPSHPKFSLGSAKKGNKRWTREETAGTF